MSNTPEHPATLDFLLQVERFYAALMETAISVPEPSLGGQLLYAGQLSSESRALIVAANIAGAASLSATADIAAQKQAIRDGVADFLVTDLDEALRILKNQLRKREPVAVCIAAAPQSIEIQMQGRGVQPDLLASSIVPANPELGQLLVSWTVTEKPNLWLPKLDLLALHCLEPDCGSARRWLRLVPRYMGRLAQTVRLLRCDEPTAAIFIESLSRQIASATIGVRIEGQLIRQTKSESFYLTPPTR